MNCPECQNPSYAPHAASCSRYTPDIHRVDGGEVVGVPTLVRMDPDSGDPIETVPVDPYAEPQTPGPDNGMLYGTYGPGREWTDLKHLMWLHDRLVVRHDENPLYDYMHRLRELIAREKGIQEALTDAGYRQHVVEVNTVRKWLGLPLLEDPWPPMPDNVFRTVTFRGLCKICVTQRDMSVPGIALAEWVDCPTGGWWSHLSHPEDEHDADVGWDPEQSMDNQGHTYTVDH